MAVPDAQQVKRPPISLSFIEPQRHPIHHPVYNGPSKRSTISSPADTSNIRTNSISYERRPPIPSRDFQPPRPDLNRVWVFPTSSTASVVSSNVTSAPASPMPLSPMTLSPTTLPFSALGAFRPRRPTVTRRPSDESDPEFPDIDTFDLDEPAGHSSLRDLMLSPGKVMDAQLYQVLNSSWSEAELEFALCIAVARWEAFVPRTPSGTGYSRPVWPIDALVPRHYARHANKWDEFSPYDPASFRVPVRDTRALLREVLRRASGQDPANAVGVPRRTASSATVPRAKHYQRSSMFSHRSSMTVASRSPSPDAVAVAPNPAKFLTEHLKLFPDLHEAATDGSNSQNEQYRETLLRGQKDHLRSASSKRREEYLAMLERTRQQRAVATAQAKRRSMFSPPPVTEVDERGLRRLSLMSSQPSERMSISSYVPPPAQRYSLVSTHTSFSLNEGQSTPETSFTMPSSPEKHEAVQTPKSAQEYHDATMGRLEGRTSVSEKQPEDDDVDLVLRLAEMGRKGMAGSLPPGVVESARAKRQASLGRDVSVLGSPLTPTSTTPKVRRSYRESITSVSSRGSRYPKSPRSPLTHSHSPSVPNGVGLKQVRMNVPESVLGDMDGEAHDPHALAADSPVESDANVVSSAWHEGPLDGIGSGLGSSLGNFGSDFGVGEASGRRRRSGAAAPRWRRATPSGSYACGARSSDSPLPRAAAATAAPAHSARSAFPSRSSSRATLSMGTSIASLTLRHLPAATRCGTRLATGCVPYPMMLGETRECAAGRLPGLPILGWLPSDTSEEEPSGPLMDISLDEDLSDVDSPQSSFCPEEEDDGNSGPLMDVSLDLGLDVDEHDDELDDEFDDLEILDEFDAFDPEHHYHPQWCDGGDTESEPELQTPTFTPPFRPLSTISVSSDVELDPHAQHRVKLPLAAVGASFVRRLAANGLRC